MCMVPGCGNEVTRPWNHIYQTREHKDLSSDDKKKYLGMTNAAACKDEVKKEVSLSLGDDEEDKADGVFMSQDLSICTIGRQKFGDSRSMGCFPPDTPILVEFRK